MLYPILFCGVIVAGALIWEGLPMLHLYIAMAVAMIAFASLAGAVIWHYGRLERRMRLTAAEQERLRGFGLADDTDSH